MWPLKTLRSLNDVNAEVSMRTRLDNVDLVLRVVAGKVRDLVAGLDVPELDAETLAACDQGVPHVVPLHTPQSQPPSSVANKRQRYAAHTDNKSLATTSPEASTLGSREYPLATATVFPTRRPRC